MRQIVRQIVRQIIKSAVMSFLPDALLHALCRLKNGNRPVSTARQKDLTIFAVPDNIELKVYWADRVNGTGPVMDVMAVGVKILRFDCFGKDAGHYHTELGNAFACKHHRIYFREESVEEQIDRSLFEVRTNLSYFLERHHNRRVRRLIIDSIKLDNTLSLVREKMMTMRSEDPLDVIEATGQNRLGTTRRAAS